MGDEGGDVHFELWAVVRRKFGYLFYERCGAFIEFMVLKASMSYGRW